jgi:hypothetical protein
LFCVDLPDAFTLLVHPGLHGVASPTDTAPLSISITTPATVSHETIEATNVAAKQGTGAATGYEDFAM